MQKVLLARALARRPAALVVAQPTRGLDVGAAAYVHDQLRAVRERGGGVLLVSEDLDELFALADRLVVLFSGRVDRRVGDGRRHGRVGRPADDRPRTGGGAVMLVARGRDSTWRVAAAIGVAVVITFLITVGPIRGAGAEPVVRVPAVPRRPR